MWRNEKGSERGISEKNNTKARLKWKNLFVAINTWALSE